MPDTTNTPVLPADHPAHQNFNLILRLILMLAPAAIAPFVKSAGAKDIFNAELPIIEQVGAAFQPPQ